MSDVKRFWAQPGLAGKGREAVLASDYDALTARCDRLEHALLTERGKLEKADAENDRLQARVAELEKGAARYEYVRRLGPRAFHSLWEANIKGEGQFDDIVDTAIEIKRQALADRGGA